MFGIGLPEMIVIFIVALLVVGPDKLPDLARQLAKGVFELKKTLNEVRGTFSEEEKAVNEVRADLKNAAAELQKRVMLDEPPAPPAPSQETANTGAPPEAAEQTGPETQTLPADETAQVIDAEILSAPSGPPAADAEPASATPQESTPSTADRA